MEEPSIHRFGWRVIKGFIPVRDNLYKGHVEKQNNSVERGAETETI